MANQQGLWAGGWLALTLLSAGLPVTAAENMRFYGTLIEPPPCQVNGDRAIEVDFGEDVLTTRVDGVNYSKPINYTLDCTGAGTRAIRVQIQGAPASFNGNVLATVERSDLGIALKLAGVGLTMPINSWVKLESTSTKLDLQAVPVKAPGSQLTAGRFTAGATMVFDYQ